MSVCLSECMSVCVCVFACLVCVCVVSTGVLDEDAVSVHAGRDFALMRTANGKVRPALVTSS